MKLRKIKIKNFRSIKEATIEFDYNGIILIGKNEAGKSNIIKAIAAVFGKYEITPEDKRKRIGNEIIDEYSIKAIFELSQEEIREIIKKEKNIEKEFEIKSTNAYAILKGVKQFIFSIDFENKLNEETNFDIGDKSNEIISHRIDLDFFHRNTMESIKKINCYYFKYSEDYLLPAEVDIENFRNNPDISKSLKHVFEICNRPDIDKELNNAINEDGDYLNLCKQISKSLTENIQETWPDFSDTRIELIPDGNIFRIKVSEKVSYNLSDRSDGFKKFISILLVLSMPSRSESINENDIILIDEPDQSLYPTSATYLKKELLKIAEKSAVIYSTHCQFMIDSDCIDRHLIVKRENDVTTMEKSTENSPFAGDELLRRAIGTTIFDAIKDKNIIFEGYLDKKLFNKYSSLNLETNSHNYGQVYLHGISGIFTLIQLLMLVRKKFIIVTDSDDVSISKKKKFEEEYSDYKNCWFDYKSIHQKINTMEDFFADDYIASEINKHNKDFKYDTDKTAMKNIENAVDNEKNLKNEIKKNLIDNMQINNLRKEDNAKTALYSVFVKKVLARLKNM